MQKVSALSLPTPTGVTATGNGLFVSKGDKNSWGNKDRDVLYLDYTLQYDGITCATKDTLVVRDRGVKADWFKYEQSNSSFRFKRIKK